MLRNCQWNGKSILNWDANLISESDEIPNEIKKEILGAKREILFVEGESESLDRQIYQLIFPSVTVLPQGSCTQVERAVKGIRRTESLHWINAYGLIDADDRTSEQIQNLFDKGIAALECYSVESLYYNLSIVNRVAEKRSEFTGEDAKKLFERAISGIIESIQPHKKRLCSRLCEKQVRNKVMASLPKHRDIAEEDEFEIKLDLKDFIEKEETLFDKLIFDNNLNGLIARYPVRETPLLSGIANGVGLKTDTYESAVRKLIVDDLEVLKFYRMMLSNLTKLITVE